MAKATNLILTVVTPEKRLVSDLVVDQVWIPGAAGELNVLPGHAPLITTLDTGVLKYQAAGSQKIEKAVVSWGYCEVVGNQVNLLTETVETKETIDRARAEQTLKVSLEKLSGKEALSDFDREKYQRKIRRAQNRLQL
ncbi:MAG: ATP synthase F1 subunit epsilon [Bdellovibrionales bacterium CG10_big_fil_rev_8_21_14_0_10_45_34]|nr:MAG: ATP synthase F1 subunit epsilon [Bdellovibrionales bacterium CG10_big_fil_rev_8_21_14_0_10_45_34]